MGLQHAHWAVAVPTHVAAATSDKVAAATSDAAGVQLLICLLCGVAIDVRTEKALYSVAGRHTNEIAGSNVSCSLFLITLEPRVE